VIIKEASNFDFHRHRNKWLAIEPRLSSRHDD